MAIIKKFRIETQDAKLKLIDYPPWIMVAEVDSEALAKDIHQHVARRSADDDKLYNVRTLKVTEVTEIIKETKWGQ